MADAQTSRSSERLVSRLSTELRRAPRAPRAGLNLAAFLAQREEIAEALEHGYSIKAVWSQLRKEGGVQMAYETFRDYCRSAALSRRPVSARRSAPKSVGGMPRQTFQHSSVPDKKQLY